MKLTPSLNHRLAIRIVVGMVVGLCVSATSHASIIGKLEQGRKVTITAIGTSLTARSTCLWFNEMGQWLNGEYPGQVTLYNEAVSASASKYTATYTSPASGLDVQLGKALAHNPDAIFIEFAINDAYTPYSITEAMSRENLQTMIDDVNDWASAHSKSVDVVVQTMNNETTGQRPNLADYYQGYRDVANANAGVLLIDHYPTWLKLYREDWATWRSYMADAVHPNAAGAQNLILPQIKQALLAHKSSVRERPSH